MPINTAPILDRNEGLQLDEANTATIISSSLRIEDADKDTVTYTLTALPANGTLKLNGTALDLSSNKIFTQADIDNNRLSYTHNGTKTTTDTFSFTATDGQGGNISNTTFNITVKPYNHIPSEIKLSNNSVAENSASGTVIADLSATDLNVQDTHTYRLYDSVGGRFAIEGNKLKVVDGSLLNFEDKNSYDISIQATDNGSPAKSSAWNNLKINITDVNEAPTVSQTISPQSIDAGSSLNFQVDANTFKDVDAGEPLTYQASQANGQPLPNWLNFDDTTRTFSGTPTNANAGNLNLKVTATDKAGASVSTDFNLTVNFVNSAPTNIALSNSSVPENSANGTVIADLSAADPDGGDSHTYTLVNNAGGRFAIAGNQLTVANGSLLDFESATSHTIRVKTTDSGGQTFEKDLLIGVTNVNEAPTALPISNQSVNAGSAFNYQVTANTFTDVDAGDTLTYQATLANGQPLPSWLSFNPATRQFSGTPTNANAGNLNLKVTATDKAGASVSTDFNLTVNFVNSAPTNIALSNSSVPENSANGTAIADLSAADPDGGDSHTYTLVNNAGGRFAIAGNQLTVANGSLLDFESATSHTIRVKTTDSGGQTFEKDLLIGVTNVNEAPTAQPISNQTINAGSAFNYQVTANTFTDVDAGDTLTYQATLANGQPLPSWLSFNPATRQFSGTPTNANAGNLNLLVTATDKAGAIASTPFNLTVNALNNPPVVTRSIASQNPWLDNRGSSFTFVSNTFTDPDPGDSLTYSATVSGGQWRMNGGAWQSITIGSLPSWLTFDSTNRTFRTNGNSPDFFNLNLQVQARDRAGALASDTFQIGGRSGVPNVVINNNSIVISNNAILNNMAANIRGNAAINNVLVSTINTNVNNINWSNNNSVINAVNIGISNNWWRPAPAPAFNWNMWGRAQDNYIAGAAVFLDTNKNGKLDAEEPFSLTTEKGDFNFNVDLRDFDINNNGKIDSSEGKIVTIGGTDSATGLILETPITATPDSTMVTMLTSVVADLVDKGLTEKEAQDRVKTALSLPSDVDIASFDPILATEENQTGGAEVFAEMIKTQNAVTQIASLLDGASSASLAELTSAAVSAIASYIQTGASLDLTAPDTLKALIHSAATQAQAIAPTLPLQTISNSAAGAALIMAASNQSIEQAAANNTGSNITSEVARVQLITLGEIPKDLFEVTAGIKTIERAVADNTDSALNQQILAGKLGGETLDGTAGNDTLNGSAGSDSINGGAGADVIRGDVGFDSQTGGGGNDEFIITPGDGTDMISDFGGVGKGTRPTPAVLAEVDTLKFVGAGLNAQNLLAYNNGADLVLTFDSANSPRVTLKNFALENLDNLLRSTGGRVDVANILFDGQAQVEDSFDVIDANQQLSRVYHANKTTFLNELDNNTQGRNNSKDVINGMGGNDTLTGLSGDDILRGGSGNDLLNGGAGTDTLMGGEGSDRFVLAKGTGSDVIQDFQDGIDSIVLSGSLSFAGLSIAATAGGTNISIASTGELLASLNGVDATLIGVNDFAAL